MLVKKKHVRMPLQIIVKRFPHRHSRDGRSRFAAVGQDRVEWTAQNFVRGKSGNRFRALAPEPDNALPVGEPDAVGQRIQKL